MTEEKQQLENVECIETRKFRYNNDESDLNFEFEIDVSNPEIALTEISDFKDLLAQAFNDLDVLIKTFTTKIEKPKIPEKPAKEKKPKNKKETKPVVVEEKPQPTAS